MVVKASFMMNGIIFPAKRFVGSLSLEAQIITVAMTQPKLRTFICPTHLNGKDNYMLNNLFNAMGSNGVKYA